MISFIIWYFLLITASKQRDPILLANGPCAATSHCHRRMFVAAKDTSVKDHCQALLIRACGAVARALVGCSEAATCPVGLTWALSVLTTHGGVGWADEDSNWSFCTIDALCAKAVADDGMPLPAELARLASLSTYPKDAERTRRMQLAVRLLKQLAIALEHPPHLDQLLEQVVGGMTGAMLAAVRLPTGRGSRDGAAPSPAPLGPVELVDECVSSFEATMYARAAKPEDETSDGLIMASGVVGTALDLALLGPDVPWKQRERMLASIWEMAKKPVCRGPLRDAGVATLMARLLRDEGYLQSEGACGTAVVILTCLSRSESMHAALRGLELQGLVEAVLAAYPTNEQRRFNALSLLGHLYGSEPSNHPAQQLLSLHDVSDVAVQKLGTVAKGTKIDVTPEELLYAIQSLCGNADAAAHMVAAGLLVPLATLLAKEPPSGPAATAAATSEAVGCLFRSCSCVLNLSYIGKAPGDPSAQGYATWLPLLYT